MLSSESNPIPDPFDMPWVLAKRTATSLSSQVRTRLRYMDVDVPIVRGCFTRCTLLSRNLQPSDTLHCSFLQHNLLCCVSRVLHSPCPLHSSDHTVLFRPLRPTLSLSSAAPLSISPLLFSLDQRLQSHSLLFVIAICCID